MAAMYYALPLIYKYTQKEKKKSGSQSKKKKIILSAGKDFKVLFF